MCMFKIEPDEKKMFRASTSDCNAQVESALQLTEQSIRDQNATLEVLLLLEFKEDS